MISALFHITGLLVALACLGAFLNYYRRYRRIRRIETSRVGEVRNGCFEIKGRIVALSPTLRSPLSGTPCVFYDMTIVQARRGRWFAKDRPKVQEKSRAPFGVRDETGTAVIELAGAEYVLNLDRKRRTSATGPSDGSDDRVRALLDHHNIAAPEGTSGTDGLILYETFLEEGDDLYVLGDVTRFDNDRPVFTSGDCAILISDKSEKQLRHHTLLQGALYLCLSLLMILLIIIYAIMDLPVG